MIAYTQTKFISHLSDIENSTTFYTVVMIHKEVHEIKEKNQECALVFPCNCDNFAYFKGPLQQNNVQIKKESLTFIIVSLSVFRMWTAETIPAADTLTVTSPG